MHPFAPHTRLEHVISLMAAVVTSVSILGGVVYLFIGDAVPPKPAPHLAKAAAPSASAPKAAPVVAGTLEPY